jgi:hypothetical protein
VEGALKVLILMLSVEMESVLVALEETVALEEELHYLEEMEILKYMVLVQEEPVI